VNFSRIKIKTILLSWILAAIANHLCAQSYQVRTYLEVDGLPSSTVHDIAQDASGRMWFATRAGITVYDGNHWKTYTVADGLPSQSWFRIKSDSEGRIWALNQFSRFCLSYFDGEDWILLPQPDDSNDVPAYTTSLDLTTVERRTILAVGTSRFGLYVWDNYRWKRIIAEDGLLSSKVNSIAAGEGLFYVATSKGLSVIKEDKVDNSLNNALNLPSEEVMGVAVEGGEKSSASSKQGFRIWLQGKTWIGYIEKGKFKLISDRIKIKFPHLATNFVLQPDYREGLYSGNNFEIFHVDGKSGQIKHLGKKNGLAADETTSLFLDRESNLWVTSPRGVSKISSMRFANYREADGLLDDEVSAVLEARPGTMVFGHSNGLSYFDGQKFWKIYFLKEEQADILPPKVLDLCQDSRGNIWAAVSGLGLAKITPEGIISWYKRKGGLEENTSSVLVDGSGRVWVGEYGGLFLLEKERFVPLRVPQTSELSVRRIFEGPDHSLYLATPDRGLFVFSHGEWKNYISSQGEGANNVYSVLADSEGRTWVGSMEGLYILDHDLLRRANVDGFQIKRPVYFIVEDKKARLWFGTDNGVIRWDGQHWRQYSVSEGLAGHETNRAAGFVDSQGRVWIGTERGVSCYQEEFDNLNLPPPLVELSFLEASGERIPVQHVKKLAFNKNNLVFHFKGISFIDEDAVRYTSKLEGFDKDWLAEYQSIAQQIRYTNLPPGRYRFHLRARNAAGVWSDVVSSPGFVIRRPFWREWWFYLLSFLFIGFVFYSVQRYFSEKRYFLSLKKQVEERTVQLRQSEKRYRSLVETALEGIGITDPDENFIFVNDSFAKMLGYEKKELLGLNLSQVSNKEGFAEFKKETEKRRRGESSRYEAILYTKSGKPRNFIVSACPFFDENRDFAGTLAMVSDISELKKAEERLKASLKEKEVLLQEVHHRVKNNLQIISSLLNLQAGYIKDKKISGMFKSSQDRIRSMSLIHERLYQSRDFAKIDTVDYIRKLTLSLFKSYKVNTNLIKLKVDVKDVFLDINTLIPCGLIINELVTNSLKHAFPGGRQGEINIDLSQDKDNKVTLTVADNGAGMPKSFDLKSEKSLGIRLVSILASQIGGSLEIEREKGTRFKIRF